MREPDNHTALVDKFGDTWIRYDESPGRRGTWWPLTDGPGWEPQARNGVGNSFPWDEVAGEYGPLAEADPQRTAAALARVREEATR